MSKPTIFDVLGTAEANASAAAAILAAIRRTGDAGDGHKVSASLARVSLMLADARADVELIRAMGGMSNDAN